MRQTSNRAFTQNSKQGLFHVPFQLQQIARKLHIALDLHRAGQLGQAKALYDGILKIQPNHYDALQLSGAISAQTKNWDAAHKLLTAAFKINTNSPSVCYNLGLVLKELRRLDEALVIYKRAIELKPDFADAYFECGNTLIELQRFDEALASYDKAIEIHSDFAQAYSNRGNTLKVLRRFEEALLSYRKATSIRPDYAEVYLNLGNILKELNRLDEALVNYQNAITFKPDYAEAYLNLGNTLKEFNRSEEALANYDKAITFKPDYAEAHWNKSLVYLVRGQFKLGWLLHEWRWKYESFSSPKRNFTQPLWLGKHEISGKTILLHSEQGLGDTIQFCRYAMLVKALGAKVLLEAPKALIGLLQSLEGVDTLVETGNALPSFDYHCPLLSLPLAFETELTSIPNPIPYLKASQSQLNAWSVRLGEKSKPRIGLAWSGNALHTNDRNRSLPLAALVCKLSDRFEYISLQRDVREIDKLTLGESEIRHFGEQLEHFTDTAALCELMDLVISVDTSIAHLAGSLGKTTWLLLPYAPDWRWLLDRKDSPWYASLRLFRKNNKDFLWDALLEHVVQELIKCFEVRL